MIEHMAEAALQMFSALAQQCFAARATQCATGPPQSAAMFFAGLLRAPLGGMWISDHRAYTTRLELCDFLDCKVPFVSRQLSAEPLQRHFRRHLSQRSHGCHDPVG